MDLKEEASLGPDPDRHWYYASKSRMLLASLGTRAPTRILDVGAGSGLFSRMLLCRTAAAAATCVDTGYQADRVDVACGKPIVFARSVEAVDADVVLLMDVLEHVDDDLGVLRSYADIAQPGTRFVITVPAFQSLWSAHDEFLEHRRRYRLTQVIALVSGAGLAPLEGFYFFAAILPVVALYRRWKRSGASAAAGGDLRRHHRLTNAVLTLVCRLEARVARRNRVGGLSVFVVAEKPA
jgi:SAM-dependent methyltransferase